MCENSNKIEVIITCSIMFQLLSLLITLLIGRLGLGTEESTSYNKPVQVNTLPDDCTPINVVCGFNSSVVLTAEGRTFCTGSNR